MPSLPVDHTMPRLRVALSRRTLREIKRESPVWAMLSGLSVAVLLLQYALSS
jgi:hypothetical protein